ncbi:Gel (predicted) [Pycnogonum litorale]
MSRLKAKRGILQKLQVKALPQDQYGNFYSGDSYIVLHTKAGNGSYEWNLHFWLGSKTSQDEAGAAAIKTVELDDHLGGSPVQHREVEDHESKIFLSNFKKGIRYLKGGVASGFRHVDLDHYENRLLQVKGRRNVKVRQVELSAKAMNNGDCFILDAGKNIYVWVGPKSGRTERLKAVMAADALKTDLHAGRSKIHVFDETTGDDRFFTELGAGSKKDVMPAEAGGEDVAHERSTQQDISLHKISDASGKVKVDRVAGKPLKQEMLNSSDCFLLDTGTGGIFAWVGKKASKKERSESMRLATEYLKYKGYPNWTPVARVIDGGEPPVFKQYFSSWKEPESKSGLGRLFSDKQMAAAKPEKEFNVRSLHSEKRRLLAKNAGRAYGFMPDDGSGDIEIYRVENFELVPVDKNTSGMFFGGDSYVLKYSYNADRGRGYVIYFWQGMNSSQDEKAASAIHAVHLDDKVQGKAVQVRVVQGNEPQHFLRIFKGKMIIFMGGKASGFKNVHDHDTYDKDGTRLFHVKGTSDVDIRAVQVPEVASYLNSDDVFVLETPSVTFLWMGKNSIAEEKTMGKKIVPLVSPGRKVSVIDEGMEPNEFWKALGGKGPYKQSRMVSESPLLPPRMFHCSDARGKFNVEEITEFNQDDLNVDDVMILDSGDEIFVWVGQGANEDEKKNAFKIAEDYVKTDPTDRSLDNTVIIKVKQDSEPAAFTALFDSWNPNMWTKRGH